MSCARILGSVVAGLALTFSLVQDANAYAVKKTSRGELVHWEAPNVTYTIDPSVEGAVPRATEATLDAMKSWSGTVGAPELATTDGGPKAPAFDQKNGIFFMKNGWAPAGRALAITVLTYDNATGRILDADVIFNGSYAFEVISEQPELSKNSSATHLANTDQIGHEDEELGQGRGLVYDLHHVIAHELGHSLGMNDEMGRKDALMYRYSAPNDATIRQPASDDIAGLAELYSTKLEAQGSGCGNATVAPKKPSHTASRAAMFAALGLLAFLLLRARGDRRARAAFVIASAAMAIAFLPTLSGGNGSAHAGTAKLLGHAHARVLRTSTAIESGLFRTRYELSTTTCRAASCPKTATGITWGGTIDNLTQEVGGLYAPHGGDEVDVSFKRLPDVLGALKNPLASRDLAEIAVGEAAVITR